MIDVKEIDRGTIEIEYAVYTAYEPAWEDQVYFVQGVYNGKEFSTPKARLGEDREQDVIRAIVGNCIAYIAAEDHRERVAGKEAQGEQDNG